MYIDTKVEIFHGPVLNIINNFVAKKIITVDDREEHSEKECDVEKMLKKCLFRKIAINFDILNMKHSNFSMLYTQILV